MDESLLTALRCAALTRVLEPADLERIAAAGQVLGYLPGTYIYHESQPRRCWRLVLKGQVRLQQGPRARPRVLALLSAGDSFGEGALLDDYPHSTSAYVVQPTEVFQLPRPVLADLSRDYPGLYQHLVARAAQVMAEQIRAPGIGESYLSGGVRTERDLLGTRDVPDTRYYGIQTLRAVENFPITGIRISQYPLLVRALAAVKEASALANRE
ncbi:MAG: cyclic nucleotide-binding domain-containing protein, partial [Gemmatimonadetes bacterium]|nr:cyclic nucleotide-binding domain-containing protein [Gemmatimonadota bacterium]